MNQEILKASYLSQKEADKNLSKYGLTRDPFLSTIEHKVYVDKQKQPTIINRGSKRLSDFLEDALIAVGLEKHSHRYLDANRNVKKVREKYNKEPDAYGHSLGGFLSSHSGTKGKVVSYNSLVPLTDIGKTIPKNHTEIRTVNDIPSIPLYLKNNKYNNVRTIKSKSLNPITAHNLNQL
jgi:hypothetical protein